MFNDQSSSKVISTPKELFSTHSLVISDNGPQFSANSFRQFAADYGFVHVTSFPQYPKANGEAEREARTAKALLRKNDDLYLALLAYRSTPLQNGFSPSDLLMGRRLRTKVPVIPNVLQLNVQSTDRQRVEAKEDVYRSNQQNNYNQRYRTQQLPPLIPRDQVWIRDQNRGGRILRKTEHPRSYLVKTDMSTVRCNRSAL